MVRLKARACLVLTTLLVCSCKRDGASEAQPTGSAQNLAAPHAPSDMSSPFDPKRAPNRLAPDAAHFAAQEWAATSDYRLRFLAVKECEVESYFAPKEGNIKLGIELELEGLSTSEVPSNAMHAALVDGEGTRYAATLAGCQPSLPTRRVTKGQNARGFVTFEIPKGATGLVLRYEPLILGRAESALSFDLGR